jgi:alpha-ketoglutarate-dependent taurine dioxygenase
MKLIVKPDAKNYLFSREAVPMHWDGAFHVEPKYIVFYCKRAVNGFGSGPNGATLFADVERMWADLSAVERAATGQVRQRFRTEKLAHYGGDVTRNLVEDHPTKAKPVLRLAEPVSTQKNPVSLELQPEGPSTQSMVSSLHQRLYQPEYLYRHSWKAGDLLIADNHSLLHGREALSQETQREIWRVQLA